MGWAGQLPGAGVVDLTPFVPRLVVEWLRDEPDSRWREVDGTLAFVDVSGFTAMSERLAREGKSGAEQVTEVMNATFARLLEVAYSYGGGLLKFGGDALLILFDGADHPARAAAAAHGMRDALAASSHPATAAGEVTLRMHVGLHSERFHFFLVGDGHRELIVTGPAATRTVAIESASAADEILVSESTAAGLERRAVGARKDGAILLRAAPAAEPQFFPLPDTTGLDLERCVPVAVRQELAAGAVEPEHRQATVAFVRFSGADALIESAGPAAAADAVEELVLAAQRAAEEHGVCFLESDIDADGGRIVLVAGAPQTSENDEERMLRTVRAVADSGTHLTVAVGVNRGRVFAGEVGAPFRRTYTILGDTAALAARLMARAERGTILAAREVVERSRTTFESVELEPFQVKGRGEPVRAVALGPIAGTRALEQRRLDLVGREREMAIVGAALAPVRGGSGTLVELIGEAGIGKSRLVEEIRSHADDMRPVSAACEQYEASTPYFAFRDVLRGLLDLPLNGSAAVNTELLRGRLEEVAPELVPWIPLLAIPLDVEVEPTREVDELQPAFRRARLHGVVAALLARLLPDPTLLQFEDVHWMDEASSDLLRHLGGQVASRPWFACVTRRPVAGGFSAADGTPPVPALTIRLEPLPPEAAKRLAAAAAGDGVSEEELEAIAARAGGNPLFLQELLSRAAAPVEEELPESVEAVVAAKIDRLGPADRALLRWASVLGTSFDGELVASVLEDDPTAAADSEAWDRLAEFVERDPDVPGGFRFRHALIRDAAYEGLAFARRQELHARVGTVYEHRFPDRLDEHAQLLSLHFSRAGLDEQTWRYSLVAGDRARAKYANVEAADFYRRAVDAAGRLDELLPDEVSRIWEALGDVLELAGRYREAGQAYRCARRLGQRTGKPQPGLFEKEGVIRERQGHYAGALRRYARGRAEADRLEDPVERTSALSKLQLAAAGVRYRQGELGDCIALCEAVLPDSQSTDDLESLAHAYYLLHLAYTSLGSPERLAFRGLALPIYEEVDDLLGQANVLNNLGIDAYYEGRWSDSLDLYERSRALRERIGDVVGAATITNNIGEILSDQGRLDDASRLFEEVQSVCDAAGNRLMSLVARANLGRAAARSGRLDEADRLLHEALAGFVEIQASGFVLETEARLAELLVQQGRFEEAYAEADGALRSGAVGALAALLHRVRADALAGAGDAAAARPEYERSLEVAETAGVQYEAALTLRALGHEYEAIEILNRLGVHPSSA